jgi:hypothetical protein
VDGAEQRVELASKGPRTVVYATTIDVDPVPKVDIPPRSTRSLDLYFPLPGSMQDARALPAFSVAWTVHLGPRVVAKRTSFERFLSSPPSFPRERDQLAPGDAPNNGPLRFGAEPPNG